MIKEKRFDFILSKLDEDEVLTYDSLALALSVSEDTIRRDIDYLDRSGLLSKVRGGAMSRTKNPLNFEDRNGYMNHEKDIIAKKALAYLKEGDTVFMDGGTTMCILARYIPMDISLRIVTNNVPLIQLLLHHKKIELIALGGTYNFQTGTFTGNTTKDQVSNFVADVYFMGVCGIDSQFGITAVVETDAQVKKAMVQYSKKKIAMANHERLQDRNSFKVCDWQSMDVLITDLAANSPVLDGFRNGEILIR